MASRRKKEDGVVRQIEQLLTGRYRPQHPKAKIKVYRYNSASVRIRIIDPDFARRSIPDRENAVWDLLDTLPEEVRSEITVLLPLTPDESKSSLLSLEFDDPTPSKL
jgi:hypothetical protein